MEHKKMNCKTCKGLDECTKYCHIRAGESILRFINTNETRETQIGEFKGSLSKSDPTQMVVSGYMIDSSLYPINIITKIGEYKSITQGKFSNYLEMTPEQLLKAYLEQLNLANNEILNAIEQLKRINSNRFIIIPFKVGTNVAVISSSSTGTPRKVNTSIENLKWTIDEKTGELEGVITVNTAMSFEAKNYEKYGLCKYGEAWIIPSIESTLKDSEIDRELIQMTNVGLIRPIEISSNGITMSIDNQYLYYSQDGYDYIAGSWEKDKLVENGTYSKFYSNTKAYKRIIRAIRFIEKHKKLIIPYGLTSPNHIEMK